jgi:hypothetical protein
VGKPEGKRPLGRPRRRWVDNIMMDLREVGWGDVDWIGLDQDRNRCRALVNSVLNLGVPLHAGKLSSGLASGGLSSTAQLHRVSGFSLIWRGLQCNEFVYVLSHEVRQLQYTHFLFVFPQVQVILRPTVSLPVRLGIGPPLGR